jgi:hypothetical protein
VMLDIDTSHVATASKDRTGLFDGQYFTPSVETGRALLQWLETGVDEPEPDVPQRGEVYCTVEDYKSLVQAAVSNGWEEADVKAYLRQRGYSSIRQVPASACAAALEYFSRPVEVVHEEATADADGADGANPADGAGA